MPGYGAWAIEITVRSSLAVSIIQLTNGREFSAAPGVSILDAALSAKISLPYSCKSGRCSACKAQVQGGRTRPLIVETGLTPDELQAGWILTCAREVESDITLDADDLGGIELPHPRTLPCRIAHLEHLASDVLQVKLRLPPTADFAYMPGQYIDVIGPGGHRRSYSLARACSADKQLELHIRAVEGGVMSQYWFAQAKVNDLLRLHGPLGTFFLRETAGLDLVFMATGTGFAPVKAMLESLNDLAADLQPRSVTLFWGGRKIEDLYADPVRMSTGHVYVPVLSRAPEDWTGARGYVQSELLKKMPELACVAVYACGSDAMIRSAKLQLEAAGLQARRFYADAFVSSGN